MGNMKLPSHLTTEDFTRAVAAATVSALRHQSSVVSQSGHKARAANVSAATEEEEHEGGGHESPNWTRGVSTGVLLGCTVLFAMIAGMSPVVVHG
jgi:Ca2+:H+ antiporter